MYATYLRLNLHVFDSRRDVVRAAHARIARDAQRDPAKREERKRFYREMLGYHRDAQQIVHRFRL